MDRLVYKAICLKPNGEAVDVINSDYNALLSGIKRYGFTMLSLERVKVFTISLH
jgi:hypothetical protein